MDEEWKENYMWNKIKEQLEDTENYLFRITGMLSLRMLHRNYSDEFFEDEIFPILAKLAEDKVPNVRFYLSKTITELDAEGRLNSGLKQRAFQFLNKLLTDSDEDVSYFASEAMSKLQIERMED